jgi:hypothetical protein
MEIALKGAPMSHAALLPALAVALAGVLCAAPPATAAADPPWLHLRAEGDGPRGSSVHVNLPLAMVEAVVALLPEADLAESRIVLGDEEVTVAELRRRWRRLERHPRGIVETGADGARTVYRRRGDLLLIETTDPRPGGGRTAVRLSAAIVDALLSGHGDRLDLAAAVRAMASARDGQVVVVGDEGRVEVWVDGVADPAGHTGRRRGGSR